ncbi:MULTISPECIES: SAM-dependent methyltransferase [unclassified Undibacterium]|uniref:SAM-dependent methyltransferase n=1 Tax=unclassified Undibacterium TaxID=2630295 RepID=UPI002AC947EB|nr:MULTISPECIES: SAM-dependent methyltransferase [unclassified Undibacterium]MEB0138593.1 SAM-dependent methyltransferase [Undibacterium sp. CCC2.1]MEB0171343.1 SAM-dependent methyltransferase [Undibacterium sp. CCC1.1]MEB0175357.1 SAM-dependent methyltransferase [Undibacterium sp. CCC3.4]MEB0214539.1 SAM-dependent methyltransferase [Undibacterium sp. 5I2]WPX43087.1 SAM-dependent methyltransferase [Undibacterium sp. CCC3.4]
MTGTLFLIPNTLGDNDTQAADILASIIPATVQAMSSQLGHFVAENAKTTRAYLKFLHQQHPLRLPMQEISIAELNVNTPAQALQGLLQPLLEGHDVGLISEAGVPAVADPGANLVRLAHARGIRVRPLVGPSSLLLGLMASGLNGQSFAFHGYLPTDAALRAKRIKELEERSRKEQQTQLLIETPYRNIAMLEALATHCAPSTLLCVATDLSLATESIQTRSAAEWKQALSKQQAPDFHKKPTVFLFLAN